MRRGVDDDQTDAGVPCDATDGSALDLTGGHPGAKYYGHCVNVGFLGPRGADRRTSRSGLEQSEVEMGRKGRMDLDPGRVVLVLLALSLGGCKEAGMSSPAEPDDIPTITEQRLANGKRSIRLSEGVLRRPFPVRLVVREVDGSVVSDVVMHGPPQRDKPSKPLTPAQKETIRELLRKAQERDPERYAAREEKLRQLGFPVDLLDTPVRTGEGK